MSEQVRYAGAVTALEWETPPKGLGAPDGFTMAATALGMGSVSASFSEFGFDLPAGAVITGIGVTVTARADGGVVVDASLLPAGDTRTSDALPFDLGGVVVGGAGDLWGESWTAAAVADDGFGVSLVLRSTDELGSNVEVDGVGLAVQYRLPGGSWRDRNYRRLGVR